MGEVSSCQKARGIGELPPGNIWPFSLYALMIVANGLLWAESLMNSALDPFPQASFAMHDAVTVDMAHI